MEARSKNLSCSITPHSAYSLSDKLIEKISEDIQLHNSPVSIHFFESDSEKDLFTSKSGPLFQALSAAGNPYRTENNPVEVLKKYQAKDNPVLLIHNTYATRNDVDMIKSCCKGVVFVLCPKSNLFIEGKLPDVKMLVNSGMTIALGTDSLASNDSLSVLEEILTLQKYFPFLSINDLIRFATLNGAKALQQDCVFGSIEAGKKPGINLIQNIDFKAMKFRDKASVVSIITD